MATQQEKGTATDSAEPMTLEIRDDGIAVITIDCPGEAQNTLGEAVMESARKHLADVTRRKDIKGLIFRSAKPGSFIAGADIRMLQRCGSAQEVSELSRAGQRAFDQIEDAGIPVVAAVDGACLGGGLELAMACHARVCTDSEKTVLGLPEVQLGLLPGSGGTQRLPRYVGIPAALDMMMTGKHVRPGKARRMGLVDDVVPASIVMDVAVEQINRLQGRHRRAREPGAGSTMERVTRWALEKNPLGRSVVFKQAEKQMLAQTKGNYPAPKRILEVVEAGLSQGMRKGLELEAKAFGELAMTPEARQLMGLYFATTAMKKDTGVSDPKVTPREVHRVGVLGAGLMGAGISYVTADKAGIPVRLKDVKPEGLSAGMKHVHDEVTKKVKRKSISAIEGDIIARRVTGTLDFSGFRNLDMVIEAVFEKLDLKHQMIRDIEANCREDTIFATNTSSIPITDIAGGAKRPENVIGMHYFSPVEKMPLLEVIATDRTAPEVIATVVDVGRKQGKTPIVVKDGAGFYVNRILSPYINEAMHLLGSGVAIDRIDKALVQFGFPVGPFKLLDEVGIDISAHVAPILHEAFGERMKPVSEAGKMIDDGRLGKKAGKGFYDYSGKSSGKDVDEAVYKLLGVEPTGSMKPEEIVDRTVLMMLNEAAICYQEGLIRSARDGDIGAVFGIGFPPFRGGPFRYMDSLGLDTVLKKLETHHQNQGERYAPARIISEMAEKGERFHKED
ncbi:fatty acid oxidation complex subunit alpha FadJ [Ectothiorhodospiraceae bacterium WFHF3C12]|nr:fatty acid oxidation complex subunit alpha FadJ [Ectothiorhodospiraceae bacterium WFHF3C12]